MAELTKAKFEERCEPIVAHMAKNDIGTWAPLIQGTMDLGLVAKTDEERGNLWDSIRSMVKNVEGLTLRHGRRSSLPAEIMVNVQSVRNVVKTACAALIENNPVFLEVILPHGKTGGNFTQDSFAEYFADKAESALIAAYRDKPEQRWNGMLDDNGMTGMVAPVKAESNNDESSEVSEEE